MIRYAIACLGCKVNTYEAGSIQETLNAKGYKEVDFKEEADIYLIFTCAVTNTAASKSRQKINQAIRQNKDALICVVGCYVQINAENMKDNEFIDILVGSNHKHELPQLIESALHNREKVVLVDDVRNDVEFEDLPLTQFEHQTRAYMKIQDGCNQFCSYCIIPTARGKERSLPLAKVIENSKQLAKKHKEIVLAGIHTGRYGIEFDSSLTQCIAAMLNEIPELERIRISSIEMSEITDELIALMQQNQRIARHLHIPLQSGCDATLKRMNRPYTTAMFYDRIAEIRKSLPGISISTDLIVGFPQESAEEFNQTVEFIKKCKFTFLHVFPFSAKTGTAAEKMSEQVSDAVKKERVLICSNLSKNLYYEYKGSFINQTVDVLIEEVHGDVATGHSSEYLPVTVEGSVKRNEIVQVTITHMIKDNLVGK